MSSRSEASLLLAVGTSVRVMGSFAGHPARPPVALNWDNMTLDLIEIAVTIVPCKTRDCRCLCDTFITFSVQPTVSLMLNMAAHGEMNYTGCCYPIMFYEFWLIHEVCINQIWTYWAQSDKLSAIYGHTEHAERPTSSAIFTKQCNWS